MNITPKLIEAAAAALDKVLPNDPRQRDLVVAAKAVLEAIKPIVEAADNG